MTKMFISKTKKENHLKIKSSLGEKVFRICNVLLLLLMMVTMIYPIWHVICASFSDANFLNSHTGILLFPKKLSLNAYKMMIKNPMIISGYANTLFIVTVGTTLNLIMTSLGAYFLSRKNVRYQKIVMVMIVITMYFSGGMIPFYFTVTGLGLQNSLWAIILPTMISTYNLIIMRSSFISIPTELEEAAQIDGAGHLRILVSVILPCSKSILAVMFLYYAVANWNAWFNAMLFLDDRTKYPLQLVLREILIQNDTTSMTQGVGGMDVNAVGETIKYAVIVVATLPILCVYPFIQKYFVSGTMIGAVKG